MTSLISLFLIGPTLLLAAQDPPDTVPPTESKLAWYRGNTHTHTLWSDGDAPPEHAVKWYVDNDYDFLVLSDHNIMQEGERWHPITSNLASVITRPNHGVNTNPAPTQAIARGGA